MYIYICRYITCIYTDILHIYILHVFLNITYIYINILRVYVSIFYIYIYINAYAYMYIYVYTHTYIYKHIPCFPPCGYISTPTSANLWAMAQNARVHCCSTSVRLAQNRQHQGQNLELLFSSGHGRDGIDPCETHLSEWLWLNNRWSTKPWRCFVGLGLDRKFKRFLETKLL
jgi:hypothetical protein